ncbi:hypothetical protein BDZ91DRAFT_103681 [Kalaharituber pfeilii]|nr:hypothetical protein BDZ91DRAFT_103681 [Kalaharituber pfeilii]
MMWRQRGGKVYLFLALSLLSIEYVGKKNFSFLDISRKTCYFSSFDPSVNQTSYRRGKWILRFITNLD